MIPAGTYDAQAVSDALFSNSSKKGTAQVAVSLRTEAGDITWIGYLSDAALPYTEANLATMGYDGESASSVKGAKIQIVVEHETYEGKPQARVKYINEPGGGLARFTPMSTTEESLVKVRLKAAALVRKAAKGAQQKAAVPATDDAPFDL
jgi:hypothetical protein